ncbi:unnamed protein product [Pseudo-nitzschia multistriata]|uniref:SRP54-type proteins GTP-binding domain-containing protein n=1 Tax=Pseudo-nitzschia multistriata TaxID=183589 RepID=A0A448YUD7_9STRA|nr:unnamed protein product [Pseudo-nitzschia multistriata]
MSKTNPTMTRPDYNEPRFQSTIPRALRTLLVVTSLATLPATKTADAFAPVPKNSQQHRPVPTRTTEWASPTTTELSMVFDFFKQRSSEGIEQLSKLTDAAAKGNLGQGLADAASYTAATNEAFAAGLALSRNRFLNNLDGLFGGASSASTIDELLEDLQDVLLQADLGVATSEDIVAEVKSLSENNSEEGKDPRLLSREDLMSVMRGVLIETLDFETPDGAVAAVEETAGDGDDASEESEPPSPNSIPGASAIRFASKESKIPTVLFIMGANGMGKTTTIGKLANRLKIEGDQKVLLAACDTFRAGAVDQLQMWADRAEVDLLGPTPDGTSSPTTIAKAACEKALAEGYDTVMIDTAGRLSNNWELNEELVRMKGAIQEALGSGDEKNEDVPHEALLVLDAAQGRMALDSARVWNKEIGLSGLVLTKLDGTARGGSVVAISKELDLPVKLIGVGEGIDDLRDFEGEAFVDGLLGIGSAGGKASGTEGAELASRLEALRKERAKRTPVVSKQVSENKEAITPRTFNHVSPQGAAPPKRTSKRSNRRKKAKKGKKR